MHELARQYASAAQVGDSPRLRHLTLLDAYYHGCQYDGLPRAWHEDLDSTGKHIPFLARRPSTVLPIPRIIVNVFTRALWGTGRRPKATFADGKPEDNALIDDVITEARLYRVMAEATRRAFCIGTGIVVWRLLDGRLRADAWDAKHATPAFRPGAFPELAALDYRYKYTREVRDEHGRINTVTYWHRETIDAETWTVYHDVELTPAAEPTWTVDTTQSHGLGFVPAVWFAIDERGPNDFDGSGLFAPYLELLDELNRTASQMGRALHYNLDPQTVITGAREGDLAALLKGGSNTWVLPEKADAKLLESAGGYVEQGAQRHDLLKKMIFDAAGVVLPDPERISGAQSGASLELLAAPQAARVDELREDVGDAFVRLLEQVMRAFTSEGLAPDKVKIDVRDGRPRRDAPLGRLVLQWGAHFPITATDALQAADAVTKATSAQALSRAAAARYLAHYFKVEDVEADQELVDAEQSRLDDRLIKHESRQAVADHRRFAGYTDDESDGAPDHD